MSQIDSYLRMPAALWAFEIVPYLRMRDVLVLRSANKHALVFFTKTVVPVLKQLYNEELDAFHAVPLTENQITVEETLKSCLKALNEVPEALLIVRTYTANVHPCIYLSMALFCQLFQPSQVMYPMQEVKKILKIYPTRLLDKVYKNFLKVPTNLHRVTLLKSWLSWTLQDVQVSCDMAARLMELVLFYVSFQEFLFSAGDEATAYIRRRENCRQYEKCLKKLENVKMPKFKTQRPRTSK